MDETKILKIVFKWNQHIRGDNVIVFIEPPGPHKKVQSVCSLKNLHTQSYDGIFKMCHGDKKECLLNINNKNFVTAQIAKDLLSGKIIQVKGLKDV